MGYTHYIKNRPAFTDAQWLAFGKECRALFKKHADILADGNGKVGTKPIISHKAVLFNGIGGDAHETGFVNKGPESFDFCKTARKPYDKVVVEFYKLIRKYLPDTELSSDGGDGVFDDVVVIDGKYTFLTGGLDLKVGDIVKLPNQWGGEWTGEVTALESDYESDDMETVLRLEESVNPAPAETVVLGTETFTEQIANRIYASGRVSRAFANEAANDIVKLAAERLTK